MQKQTIPYKIIYYLYFKYSYYYAGASLVAQTVKNRPATQETQTWSLSRGECLEKIPCSVQATIYTRTCLFSLHLRSLHFLRDLQLWHVGSSLRYVGSSSLTRDRTQAPWPGSVKSKPLDLHGPSHFLIKSLFCIQKKQ